MNDIRERRTILHVVLDAEIHPHRTLVRIISEEVRNFPNHQAAWDYINKLKGTYEEFCMFGQMFVLDSPDIYVMQVSDRENKPIYKSRL